MRKTEEIIREIREFVTSKGYIHALCMILFEDFHIFPEKMHEIDHRKRLSTKEASLLVGFLIQNEIDFTTPTSPQDLIDLKQKTYELLEELHHSFMTPFFEKLEKAIKMEHKKENIRVDQKEFFGKGDMLTEPIFYAGTGVHDFQYIDMLERKYKYDTKWLIENKDFDLYEIKLIVSQIKSILQKKSEKVHLYGLKDRLPQIIDDLEKKSPDEDWEKHLKDVSPMLEFHQYVELFFDYVYNEEKISIDEIRKKGWKSFYKSIVDLFVIRTSDFDKSINIRTFLNNFSVTPKKKLNIQFSAIGNYNIITSHPILKINEDKYFIPISFLLSEAIYESPFYWMINDKRYRNQAGKNRGAVGENITSDFLVKVFGTSKTFKSVKIISKKGYDETDIDVLCVLGSKALCIQVKSKKLTELSRGGDDRALQDDFQKAVQDAYEQGLVSRRNILKKESKLFDNNGNEIILSEEIDDVYLMVITTEIYPSLTHQSDIMLNKKGKDPYPIVLTIFDLELLVHYLNDPYDFLYYIKQRISLMEYFKADEEIVFLGYHLDKKLWKTPNKDMCGIDNSYGQLIDRNYFPLKAGLEISDEGDVIKHRWKNEDFNQLCNELKNINEAKITDIIFYLSDLSGIAIEDMMNLMISTKRNTINDGKSHSFSLPPDNNYIPCFGISFISLNSNDMEELRNKLLNLCLLRKYKSKGDIWIGFGSLKNSLNMIDFIAFNDDEWKYDKELEKKSKFLTGGKFVRLGNKTSRNDKCTCGSGLKYKKCCGRNY